MKGHGLFFGLLAVAAILFTSGVLLVSGAVSLPHSGLTTVANCGGDGTIYSSPVAYDGSTVPANLTLSAPCGAVTSISGVNGGTSVGYTDGLFTLAASPPPACWMVVGVPNVGNGVAAVYDANSPSITLNLPAGLSAISAQVDPVYGSASICSAATNLVFTTMTMTSTSSTTTATSTTACVGPKCVTPAPPPTPNESKIAGYVLLFLAAVDLPFAFVWARRK